MNNQANIYLEIKLSRKFEKELVKLNQTLVLS
jgi:hypothetical protein